MSNVCQETIQSKIVQWVYIIVNNDEKENKDITSIIFWETMSIYNTVQKKNLQDLKLLDFGIWNINIII